MKNYTIFFACLMFILIAACSVEPVASEREIETTDTFSSNPSNSEIDESTDNNEPNEDTDVPCVTTSLIAGQHHESGTVSIDILDGNLIVTYQTNGDWILGTTHLSIGNCNDDWVPLNGAGNPQIGQFEFTEPTSVSDHEVIYVIALPEDFEDQDYCFSAHAEVEGPEGGETAWAEGQQFSGNSWAMYDEFNTSDCEEDGDDDPNGGAF